VWGGWGGKRPRARVGHTSPGVELLLSGATQDGGWNIETSWGLDSTVPGRITGGFSMLWRFPGASGDVRVTADIRDLNRSSNLTPGSAAVETGGARTLDDLKRMVVTR
jgi:hypothetical protein